MNKPPVYTALLLSGVLTNGCATYRHRISEDFRDAVKLNVGVGLGFYTRVKATSFLDAGMGWGGYWKEAGLEDRYTDFVHESFNGCPFPIGVIPGAIPDESPWASLRLANVRGTTRSDMRDEDYTVAGQLFDAPAVAKWDAYGYRKRSPHQVFDNGEEQYTEQPLGLEAGVGLLVLNVHVGFDPVEFVDFVGALCGLDLLRDHRSGEPEGRANGGQPLSSQPDSKPAAAASRRSP